MCTDLACMLIDAKVWDANMLEIADLIYKISNIAYNNTSSDVLPLDDGVYDQLAVRYYEYNPNYQVGAQPIKFEEFPQNEIVDEKVMCTTIDDFDKHMYIRDIWQQNIPISQMRPVNMCHIVKPPITKRLINTTHKYPELVGTLDKCKFVMNAEAIAAEVFDKPSVQVFERDFIHRCLDMGVITPDEEFEMVGELKYDGISVEAEVCSDTIITALSRGDTADNIATDLTPIFGGYKFHRATGKVPSDLVFGIKFEAVITHANLNRLAEARGKSYKNARNAIIGLCGASDADRYVDYITLIPLSSSLDLPRESELKFLNHYYHSGEYNRHCFFRGNYQTILYQVREFTKSSEAIRPILPYMIDGVVISFTDPEKIQKLGRINFVNKYSMAIKFNPRNARTYFTGYTYSIGKTGEVIPMAHFKACEFIGGIHTKQTIYSYKRFMELNLAIGDEIDIDYVNDVITYVTKPDTEYNRSRVAKPEPFITHCPFCGAPIEISESGKSARCPNINCSERAIMRMVSMLSRFGFKDISEESVRALGITSFDRLMNLTKEEMLKLGPLTADLLERYINNVKVTPIEDYKLMAAFNFDGIANEKWKLIFSKYTLRELISSDFTTLNLQDIRGIGAKIAECVQEGIAIYFNDIMYCINNFNIIDTKGLTKGDRVVITGFRDKEYIKLLSDNGFDVSDTYSVTKDTKYLIISDKNVSTTKTEKAKQYGIPIYTRQEFIDLNNIEIN